jgi:hypothetical protein
MRRTLVLVLVGTVAMAVAAGGALAVGRASGASSPAVTIRIEGLHKTLLLPSQVRTGSGSITKYGAPQGKCSASSVQGALDRATHGHWKGTWSSQFNEYFITSILGEKPSGHNFWDIFVNDRSAAKGACDLKLRAGEQLLFADSDGKQTPAVLRASACVAPKSRFKVRLVGRSSKGTARPLAGVRITGNGIKSVTTNQNGVAHATAGHKGKLVLRASPRGYIRTETVVPVVLQPCTPY